MRRPMLDRGATGDVSSMMTPMIDVVFQLLIFFLWTSSFQAIEETLPSQVRAPDARGTGPTAEPPPEADFDELVVQVLWRDGRPAWTLNGEPVGTLGELRSRLATIAAIEATAPVIVDPDGAAPLGAAIDAYDVARLAGMRQVVFAAEE